MIKTWNKLPRSSKFLIGLLCISFICIIIGVIYSTNFFGVMIGTIGAVLLANVALSIFNNYFKDKEDIEKICNCLESEVQSIKLGIKKIDIENEREISPKQIIDYAKERIDIVHVYGYSWTSVNDKKIIKALSNKNIKIRVVMVDFRIDAISNAYSHIYGKNINISIQDTLDLWKEIYLASGKNNNLEIFLFDGLISHSIHLNEKRVVVKSIINTKSKFGDAITIYAHKTEGGIYEKLEQEVETLISESKQYVLSKTISNGYRKEKTG